MPKRNGKYYCAQCGKELDPYSPWDLKDDYYRELFWKYDTCQQCND